MIVIKDHRGEIVRNGQFEGELVAEVSTDDGERARWIEIKLYRRTDADGWIIHRMSDSVLYHHIDTTCRTPKSARPGQPMTAADLQDGAEPCGNCRPPEPDDMPPDHPIRIEVARNVVHPWNTEKQVVDDLVMDRRTGTPYWSEPVIELVTAAGMQHREFLALLPTVDAMAQSYMDRAEARRQP